jgi:hypothetical protein
MRARTCLILAISLAATGCATRAFDRHYSAGRWDEAVATFSADSSLHSNDRSLYRAAVILASPDLGAYQPQRARELLVRLLDLHPHSVHREPAVRFIAMIDEMERVRYAAIQRQQRLEAERSRLEDELTRIRADVNIMQEQLRAQNERNADLRGAVDRMERMLRDREEQLTVLRTELDRLKAIDLGASPRAVEPAGGRSGRPTDQGRVR